VTREPVLQTPQGDILKPDLVIQNKEGIFLVDVTVRHEDGDGLQNGRVSNITKYGPLLPDLQDGLNISNAEVLPIVVGTRGALPKQTIMNLEKLEVRGQGDLQEISQISLKESIEIYTNFMDYSSNPKVRSSYRLPSETIDPEVPSQTE
jgi:hypothetical protein